MANFIKVPHIRINFENGPMEATNYTYINFDQIVSVKENPYVPVLACDKSDRVLFKMSNGDKYYVPKNWWHDYLDFAIPMEE